MHRSRRVRRRAKEVGDLPDPGCAPDLAEGILAFVVIVALVLFLIFIGLPLLIALGELLLVLVLALAGIVGRVLFRRPWIVDAVSPTGEHRAWPVVGWGASAAARRFVADRITATGTVPTPEEMGAVLLAE